MGQELKFLKESSRSGHTVIKCNGISLCSAVDPVHEAKRWLAKEQSWLESCELAIVLGAGCGYHLVELNKAFPGLKVLCIEAHIELIGLAKDIHGLDMANIEFYSPQTVAELVGLPVFQRIARSSFHILRHQASMSLAKKHYSSFSELLVARNHESLTHHITELKWSDISFPATDQPIEVRHFLINPSATRLAHLVEALKGLTK